MSPTLRPFEPKTSPWVSTAIAALMVGVFVLDYFTPLGIIVWVFYLAPLVLSIYGRWTNLPIVLAATATGLIAVSTVTDAPGIPPHIAITNRVLGGAVLLAVGIMARRIIAGRVAAERGAWVRHGQNAILEALQGELTAAQIGERLLDLLAAALDARVGAFYVAAGDEARLAASRALDRSAAHASFRTGEGLVGQALRDPRVVTVDDVGEDAFRVEAGVAAARPRHLAVVPLWADHQPVAVLALAGMRRFESVGLDLLQALAESAAVAARTAVYRSRLQELLAETQRQADELQTQQEELRVINEELEEQGKILRESQTRLEEQQQEVEEANAQLEIQTGELARQRDDLEEARAIAERASATKSEFLANMSHELRTPLNSALILARILADNGGGNLTAEQVRHAETIYSAGNDLLALINDILDLSKIEAGRVDVELGEVAVRRLVAELEPVFQPVARQKGLRFAVDLAPGTPAVLTTDGHRLQQVLRNLLSNAFKFTEKGEVVLAISGDDRHVRLAVRDTGGGIPADKQETIFGAFRQGDATISRKYGGTGLGLAIARELTRLLGGAIELASEVGKGSTFTVVLPRDAAGASTSPPPPPPAPSLRLAVAGSSLRPLRPNLLPDDRDDRRRGRLILAIEDDARFAAILYQLAHELEFDCALASTAAEGMSLARELSPSGILLDINLPDGSGLSVLERLKRDARTRHIPVHILSVQENSRPAMALGAVGYAVKPVARDDLVKAIRRLETKLSQEVRRVLVVEDDERQRDSLRALLGGEGVEIVGAGTVAEALEALAGKTFDCMVLDLNLPDGGGEGLLETMAGNGERAFPPVIVYTGRAPDRDQELRLARYSRSIIVKGARSPERLLDEVTLFLHQVESSLPPAQQRMLRDAREREAAFEGRRILVVEDDVRNVFALTSLLEPRGARVDVARNGREALERLERGPTPDIVLMDVMMPEMDGLTATREIRKRPELKDLPIIVLTAKAMRDDQERCLAAGANDYLAKPLDIDKLLSLCRVWLPRSA